MIRLFLSDIDGCLSEPYRAWDLDRLAALRALAREAEGEGLQLGLLTGRAYPYAEAVAQALDLRGPALFESGAGWFDLPSALSRYSPVFTDEVERRLAMARRFLMQKVDRSPALSYDYGKRAQVGVVSPDQEEIKALYPEVVAFVEAEVPELVAFSTPISIDVVSADLTKRAALEWVAREEGIDVSEMAFIGDTGGDIPALDLVGRSFAPANAQAAVKERVDVVTDSGCLAGVIEAVQACLDANRQLREAA